MSIVRCSNCETQYDMDFNTECPSCGYDENEDLTQFQMNVASDDKMEREMDPARDL